jgi:FKBP-type peptidyl-prolyl cis-trans isomerase FklB
MHRTNRIVPSLIAATLLGLALPAAALADAAPAATPAPASAATAPPPGYTVGLQVGEGMRRAGLTSDFDLDAFIRGVKDALAGRSVTAEDHERLNQYMTEVHNSLIARNHTAARDFLAKNATAKGIVTTASGLQYKILAAGDPKAASPGASDTVVVHYRGTLLDGTEFDSSHARGVPATLHVNSVIQGWQEALVLMKPGAKWQLFIPPALAYDTNSRPPIPPGSLLLFDVELVSVGEPKQ